MRADKYTGTLEDVFAIQEKLSRTIEFLFDDYRNLAPTCKRLGELYEARGDRAKAVEYHRRFIDLWKGADPELQPQVAEARAALRRLGGA